MRFFDITMQRSVVFLGMAIVCALSLSGANALPNSASAAPDAVAPTIVEHTPPTGPEAAVSSAGPVTRSTTVATSRPTVPFVQPPTVPGPLDVRDDGHFFTPALIDATNALVDRLQKRYATQLIIETYAAVPVDRRVDFERFSRPEFFQRWVADRARARETDGIFILVCRDPGRVQLGSGAKTCKKAFTQENLDDLNEIMAAQFRDREFDEGLKRGVAFIEHKISINLAPTR